MLKQVFIGIIFMSLDGVPLIAVLNTLSGFPFLLISPSRHTKPDNKPGAMKDCEHCAKAARAKGLRLALDIALNCSPDHPYVKSHPEWFYHEPDGSIKFAENPPKK